MQESDNDYLNNKYPTPPSLKEGEEKISTIYIICAAIWYQDGNQYLHQPRNVDSGFVVAGRRHHNCFITTFILNGEDQTQENVRNESWKIVEGFLTSDDRFVNRKQAAEIAYNSKQTLKLKEVLFSEDLY
jgi:hypothetical protein